MNNYTFEMFHSAVLPISAFLYFSAWSQNTILHILNFLQGQFPSCEILCHITTRFWPISTMGISWPNAGREYNADHLRVIFLTLVDSRLHTRLS